MPRTSTTLIAAAALTLGLALGLPQAASADPVLDFPDVTNIEIGRTDTITGSGCTDIDGSAYVGQYVAYAGDTTYYRTFETPANPDGSWSWTLTPGSESVLADFDIYFYCASDPVEAVPSSSITWASGAYTLAVVESTTARSAARTVASTSTAPATTSAKSAGLRSASTKLTSGLRASKGKVAPAKTAAAPTGSLLTIDPDALPMVDKINIPGPRAAALKAKVDKANGKTAKTTAGTAARKVTDVKYVLAAYISLGKRLPTARELMKHTGSLENNVPKVQVVEDIALGLGIR